MDGLYYNDSMQRITYCQQIAPNFLVVRVILYAKLHLFEAPRPSYSET